MITHEWGEDLVRSWNKNGWIELPHRIGARIAALLGAEPDEVIVADSTSVNLFKLAAAAFAAQAPRRIVLSERGNFPTDLYVLQGLEASARRHGSRFVSSIATHHQRLCETTWRSLCSPMCTTRRAKSHDMRGDHEGRARLRAPSSCGI